MTREEFNLALADARNTTSCKGLQLAKQRTTSLADELQIYSCVTCGEQVILNRFSFKDPLGVKEFFISGMCEECQNNLPKEPEE